MKNRKNKILVICHDAGGTEVISAYVKKHKNKFDFQCFALSDIAERIFKRKSIKFESFPVVDANAECLISGTSWGSKAELEFIKEAKLKKIKTVVYLDHWVNYRERFGYPGRDWEKNLPDEIWVGDKYAYNLAKDSFPGKPLKLVPNLYFEEIKKEYKKIQKQIDDFEGNILFMSEPLAPMNCFGHKPALHFTEFDILEYLLRFFSKKKIKNKIIICYHPSERKDKYDAILARYSGKLTIGQESGYILKDIAQSSLVIGITGMILVIACLCGKKVVSFIPNSNIVCPLPFEGIIKIKKIEDIPWKSFLFLK